MTTKANINTHLMKEVEAACVVSLRVLWITLKKKKKKKASSDIFHYWKKLTNISDGSNKYFATSRLSASVINLRTSVHLLLGTSRTFYVLAQVHRGCFKSSLLSKTLLLFQMKCTPFCCNTRLHNPMGKW